MGQFDYLGEPLNYIDGRTEYKYQSTTDLVARMVYSEAAGESYKGKQGCYWVYANRLVKNSTQFGKSTYEILTKPGEFVGMKGSLAHKPNRTSTAWNDSCKIAVSGASNSNPVGKCLWFNTNSTFKSRSNSSGGYTFDGGKTYKKVLEKVVIGNHTFFRV